jgi:hypothetical protein
MPKQIKAYHIEFEPAVDERGNPKRDDKGEPVLSDKLTVREFNMYQHDAVDAAHKFGDEWFLDRKRAEAQIAKLAAAKKSEKWKSSIARGKSPAKSEPEVIKEDKAPQG